MKSNPCPRCGRNRQPEPECTVTNSSGETRTFIPWRCYSCDGYGNFAAQHERRKAKLKSRGSKA